MKYLSVLSLSLSLWWKKKMIVQAHSLGDRSFPWHVSDTRSFPWKLHSFRFYFPPFLPSSNSEFPSLSISQRLCRRFHRFTPANMGNSRNFDAWIDDDSAQSGFGDGELGDESSELTQEAYIGLFVRRLGMDNMPEDREQAVRALWRHSMSGRKIVDQIVAFPGILSLIISLLPSNRLAASEAAAGLLRNISLYEDHRNKVIYVGAVEEIIGILTRRLLSPQVREQAAGCLWNLSREELARDKINISELIPILHSMLDSEGDEKESVTGILANLSINQHNHDPLVASGIVKKLADLLKSSEGTKITRQEARKMLLQLVQRDEYKQIVIEEGLISVPLIGASSYQSFKPLLDKLPSFPEGVDFEAYPLPSTFGAGNLLLGLGAKKKAYAIDEATQRAIDGRARQHFLARIGLLEKEAEKEELNSSVSGNERLTIMPWYDGIPRLVLILGLEDVTVAAMAANTISEVAVNEDIRQAIQRAGSIPHLVRLLGSGDELATEAAASALERLAISFRIRKSINAHGAIPALVELLKAENAPSFVKEKVLSALDRLSQTEEDVDAMVQSGAYSRLVNMVESANVNPHAKAEVKDILDELSSREADARDKLVTANGVPALIAIFTSESPLLKGKAAHIMENLAETEQYAELIIGAGLETPLKSLLSGIKQDEVDALDSGNVVKREETWAALAAATRLLHKLLSYQKVRASMDCSALAVLLADILKSETPLHVKDWVSACLLSLDRLVGVTTNEKIPIESEVIIHDKIPRLVAEIGSSLYPDVQERAVMELHDIVSQGIEAYIATISNAGGIFPLVELLDKGTAKAREASLSILYNIGTNEENHPALIRAGIVTHLQRIIRSGSPQWMLALYLLRALPTEVDVLT